MQALENRAAKNKINISNFIARVDLLISFSSEMVYTIHTTPRTQLIGSHTFHTTCVGAGPERSIRSMRGAHSSSGGGVAAQVGHRMGDYESDRVVVCLHGLLDNWSTDTHMYRQSTNWRNLHEWPQSVIT